MISHPHIAYDQMFAAIDHQNDGWLPPWQYGDQLASGWSCYIVYSFGPFHIGVREKINFTIA